MTARTGSSLKRMAVGLALVVALMPLTGIVALADTTEATPAVLQDSTWVAGTLAGDPAGSYTYYTMQYAGDQEQLTLDFSFTPNDPARDKGVGINVYRSDGWTGSAVWDADDQVYRFEYSGDDATALTVQVYNYSEDTISYSFVGSGIAASAAEATVTTTTTETAAATEAALDSTASGSVTGNIGGAYAVHEVVSADDDSDFTVTMTYSPADRTYGDAFGFNIYSPSGSLVATGVPTDDYGTLEATTAQFEAGNYSVQVFNYSDGVVMNYSLTVAR